LRRGLTRGRCGGWCLHAAREGQGDEGGFDLSSVDLKQQQDILRQITLLRGEGQGARGGERAVKGEEGGCTELECIDLTEEETVEEKMPALPCQEKERRGTKKGVDSKRQRGKRTDSEESDRSGKVEGPLTAYFKRQKDTWAQIPEDWADGV
jgi:hypothetical protein